VVSGDKDIDDQERIIDGDFIPGPRVDMGADEFTFAGHWALMKVPKP